jgi:hypothetical protein
MTRLGRFPGMHRSRSFARIGAGLLASLVASLLTLPTAASAAPRFSFARTDYPLHDLLKPFDPGPYGVDSVAVGDLDGKNGPDVVALASYGSVGTAFVLLNNGDGTFAAPVPVTTCQLPRDVVIGQFNPSTDSFLDLAMICGDGQSIGRLLGDGQGGFGPVRDDDVKYTGAAAGTGAWAAVILMLRSGAMNGPTLAYDAYIAGLGTTLCFVEVAQLERILDQNAPDPVGGTTTPFCNIHVNDTPGPNFGDIDDWGPIGSDMVLGEYTPVREEPFPRDEALSGGVDTSVMAVTSYESQFAPIYWGYGARSSGGTGNTVALADVDGDGQNDVVMGGDGTIAMYVPGFPIDPGATPNKSFTSLPTIVKLATADFDHDGNLDIAALGDPDQNDADSSAFNVGIHAGGGDGTFAAAEEFPTRGSLANGKAQIVVADVDRDGKPDLVTVGGFTHSSVSVLHNTTEAAPSGPPPTITSFSPNKGVPGTPVTIKGTRLYKASAVKFGGEVAPLVAGTPTKLKVLVPSGALPGPIAVTTQGGTAVSAASFAPSPAPLPTVSKFSPTSGVVGTTVTIHGSGLLLASVKFGGVNATILSTTAKSVQALVPAGAASGPITLTTFTGTATSPAPFTVSPPQLPSISAFAPASAIVGTEVTIHGSNLLGASIEFGGVPAVIVSDTAKALQALVPNGAISGPITVTTAGGTAASATPFTVGPSAMPTIASLKPTSGVWGTTVTIKGNALLGASSVKFNGVAAPIVSATATTLKALAPVGSTTGTIAVTTSGGTAISAEAFTPN